MNETLLLTDEVIEFRDSYPALIDQWERQIGHGNCHPDLHFCFTLVDSFPKLRAYLSMLDYRICFAINAHIVHANWQQKFIESEFDGNLALELANREIQLTYKAIDESEAISENSKAKLYHDILTDGRSSHF
ncbi:hypothetical protein [Maribacter sp. 2210JD10-5]|uniref:hypothetical protein n=1 Tax=Maribacter sp. 2210JD10-5 TaxID=3386272 RepID=UPI0039BD8B6C